MSRPSFLEGALVALAAALSAAILYGALDLLLPARQALSLVLAALGFGYLLYLLVRAREAAGRVLLVLVWLGATGATLALLPDPLLVAATQLGLIWISRVWCFGSTPLSALLELGLIFLGALAALWALVHTGSLFLAVWSLMLIQALFGVLPARPAQRPGGPSASDPNPFDLAQRVAEVALSRIDR
jgi:hypothetical protein